MPVVGAIQLATKPVYAKFWAKAVVMARIGKNPNAILLDNIFLTPESSIQQFS